MRGYGNSKVTLARAKLAGMNCSEQHFQALCCALAQIKSQGSKNREGRFGAPNARREVEVRNEKIDDPVAPVPRTEIVTCSLRQRDPNAHANGDRPRSSRAERRDSRESRSVTQARRSFLRRTRTRTYVHARVSSAVAAVNKR